ncbi:hypothetical protein PV326_012362 [Microctonus aethiopoides]|nr:hypothetical protein PV326_012362 [Microctonus aethiopoides]
MSLDIDYILPSWESESIIQNLEISNLQDVGTEKWFQYHKKILQLNQQSVLEIRNMREETIKEWFVNYQKIPVLIYEAIQIAIWKQKVFPLIIELNGEPANTFMIYSIFYHENIAVSLMENILFHRDSLESLDDSALDLIDYAVNNITTSIIFVEETVNAEPLDTSCIGELLYKRKEIEFNIGMMSVAIIGYLASSAEQMPLSVLKRLLMTHDIPYIFTQLIEKRPWKKKNPEGEDMVYTSSWEKQKSNEEDKICKLEGQVWIGLRELLLNPKCAPYYQITAFRLSELTKLQKQLHERILDQISPLIDLRRWLSYLNVSSVPEETKPIICVEIIPQIRSSIINKYKKQWKKLARYQSESLYRKDIEYLQTIAQILSVAYDFDKINKETKVCARCNDAACKRCSKCKSVWYCGRECQVKDWSSHKSTCDKIMNKNFDDVQE